MKSDNGYKYSPNLITMGDVREEIVRAREKFPDGKLLLAALMEEVGELAQALLQGKPFEEIRGEATQVACVAIRIMEEGESTFPETRKAVRAGPSWRAPRKRKAKSEPAPKGED